MSVFHNHPNQSYAYDKRQEISTADKFYDLQESQRRYQELVEENVWLKQQIERNKHLDANQSAQCRHCHDCTVKEPVTQSNGNIVLWSMLERNKYLENKIDKLKGQYEKQAKTLSSIRSSDKWKNRFECKPHTNSCYEDKYLQLLRIRSPFY